MKPPPSETVLSFWNANTLRPSFYFHTTPRRLCTMKIFGLGTAYFKDAWNFMDGSIVNTTVTSDVLQAFTEQFFFSSLLVLRAVRALRALRPLRLISRAPGLRRVVNTVIRGLPPVFNMVVSVLVVFLIFGCVMLRSRIGGNCTRQPPTQRSVDICPRSRSIIRTPRGYDHFKRCSAATNIRAPSSCDGCVPLELFVKVLYKTRHPAGLLLPVFLCTPN